MLWVRLYIYALDILLFYIAFILFRYDRLFGMSDYGFRYNYFVTIGYAFLLYWFKNTYNANLFGFTRVRNLALAQFMSQFFSILIVYVSVSLAWKRFKNPWAFLLLLMLQFVIDVIWSYYGSLYYLRINPKKKTLLIYRNEIDKKRFGAIRGRPIDRLFEIVDEMEFDGSFQELEKKLDSYDAVFVAGINSHCRNGILKYCKREGIPGYFLPHVGDAIMQEAVHIQSFDSPVLYVNRTLTQPHYAFLKRTFDIVSSGLALILLLPLMLITALIIRLYDRGPAFYKQTRLTIDGKQFEILKFRSMRVDAEKDGVARLSAGDNDDRITPVGRFIRKCRIDELPQLINIFKGDMSVVGPRPERPEIAEQYYETIPDFKLRLQVKAGLTGYAQVYGKYNTDPYEKLEFDLLYINHMSILTDLQLCFATFFVLFQKESTSGIEVGQTTAMTSHKHGSNPINYEEFSEEKNEDNALDIRDVR
ncbi:MAG: exopolysaccharide biosynthesis polyprenyl glycosylphosphotransferase [Clostridiales bacterium]|nr:exopolysaccharide biosynthesis polyprenyl glycosylphosphotransferase [Clostridiales bacterium]